ncbi:hypothetical protein JOF48_003340 [Arthrobacter stackebrandtii]|uniref:DUF4190 domain-containing protein n=1 Tax=Arthrobacter stackebrandtii TaxID=272161 RepID=A0ABS4Z0G8_9MICC|nr:DUF4190 domain-containing protein [Arthrobacter stackebrandtii]MBP2414541.1 hypothetical protein [Arthrobacter stackebrandtii]PYH01653.1 DUF4190 domain-containing protein [Arthrobacter stackebrandtii]
MTQNTPENPANQPTPPPAYPSAPAAPQPPAPYGQQPPAYNQGQPGPYGAPAVDPGKTLGIISIILPFVGLGLVGLILGIIGKVKSKKAGFKNTPALVGIIISVVAIIGTIIFGIWLISYISDLSTQILEGCSNGEETVTIAGELVACPATLP